MRVGSRGCNQIQNPCPRPVRRRVENGTLDPIRRSQIACLGDRIVQQFAPAALIVGPLRLIIGVALALFALMGAGLAQFLGQEKLSEDLKFVARRGVDESLRGFYESLVFLISSRDFDRDAQEKRGNIRDGEAYGKFMYMGPEGSIAYSNESVSGQVIWHPVRDESWEWRGNASSIGFAAQRSAVVEVQRIRKQHQDQLIELQEILPSESPVVGD